MYNESFLERVADFFAFKYSTKIAEQAKFKVDDNYFQAFTIDQLDLFKAILGKNGEGMDIQKLSSQFVEAYFSKVFCDELSAEHQE